MMLHCTSHSSAITFHQVSIMCHIIIIKIFLSQVKAKSDTRLFDVISALYAACCFLVLAFLYSLYLFAKSLSAFDSCTLLCVFVKATSSTKANG